MRGRQTKALTPEQIERLEGFRRARHEGAESGYSLPQLAKAMAGPFGYRTVQKALQGRSVWDLHYSYIVSWLDRFVPAGAPIVDYDADVSEHANASQVFRDGLYGGRREKPKEEEKTDAEETPGATGTVRGSR